MPIVYKGGNMNTKFKSKFVVSMLVVTIAYCLLPIACHSAFLDPGYGARPVAMGGAFTAVGGDSNSMLYNPAGIASVEDMELNYMYSQLFTGLDTVNLGLGYAAIAYPCGEKYGTWGVSWANLSSQDQYSEDTFALSYARSVLRGKLDIGANVKYLTHKYTLDERTVGDPVFANGSSKGAVSLDLGAQSKVPFFWNRDLALGLAISDVNTPDVGLQSVDKVPMQVRVGAACDITEDILAALDVTYRMQDWGDTSQKLNVHAGGEVWFLNGLLAARAGANLNEVAAGFGFAPILLKSCDLQLDYSFVMPLAVQETSGSHRISLIVRFLGYKPVAKTAKPKAKVTEPKPAAAKPPVSAITPAAALTPTAAASNPTSVPEKKKPAKSGKIHAIIVPEN